MFEKLFYFSFSVKKREDQNETINKKNEKFIRDGCIPLLRKNKLIGRSIHDIQNEKVEDWQVFDFDECKALKLRSPFLQLIHICSQNSEIFQK